LDSPATALFNESHPAPACRFRQHVEFLKSIGWWIFLDDVRSPQKATLERLAKQPDQEYLLQLGSAAPGKDELLIPAFLHVLPHIWEAVKGITEPVAVNPDGFDQCRAHVEKCLGSGIVPSVLMPTEGTPPQPAFIVNASFTFYMTSLDALMERLRKNPLDIQQRGVWMHRLEQWAQKALEDVFLLQARAGAVRDGRIIKN
jgi:hypothetical protein